jgi:hypothetical protein
MPLLALPTRGVPANLLVYIACVTRDTKAQERAVNYDISVLQARMTVERTPIAYPQVQVSMIAGVMVVMK